MQVTTGNTCLSPSAFGRVQLLNVTKDTEEGSRTAAGAALNVSVAWSVEQGSAHQHLGHVTLSLTSALVAKYMLGMSSSAAQIGGSMALHPDGLLCLWTTIIDSSSSTVGGVGHTAGDGGEVASPSPGGAARVLQLRRDLQAVASSSTGPAGG